MPERLIGGVLISRIDVARLLYPCLANPNPHPTPTPNPNEVARLPLLDEAADGALRLTHPTAATCPGHLATGGACAERGEIAERSQGDRGEIAERPGADGEGGALRGKAPADG